MKDFFVAYHRAHLRIYLTSGIVALALSVSIAWVINQAWPHGFLLANVIQAGSTEKVDYTADLIVERSGSSIALRLGKDAYDVDSLSLTLLGDPERFIGLTSMDPTIRVTTSESWVYLINITRDRESLHRGAIITTLSAILSGEANIAPVDPVLTSAGQSYSLSIQGE